MREQQAHREAGRRGEEANKGERAEKESEGEEVPGWQFQDRLRREGEEESAV